MTPRTTRVMRRHRGHSRSAFSQRDVAEEGGHRTKGRFQLAKAGSRSEINATTFRTRLVAARRPTARIRLAGIAAADQWRFIDTR